MPIAEAMAKEGTRSGWSLNTLVFPGGTDVKFNAVTVDVFPAWDSIFNTNFQQFYALWQKVHPDMELGTTFEQYEKLRHQGDVDVFVVQDAILSTK
jgi:heme/copper-type cytochrome/quinol oxidase subunit 2